MSLRPFFHVPYTENGIITLSENANAVIFQNVGNTELRINDYWTMYPGASLQIGSSDNDGIIGFEQIKIKFIEISEENAGCPPVFRLEVLEIIKKINC